jgi:hypothetical protein
MTVCAVVSQALGPATWSLFPLDASLAGGWGGGKGRYPVRAGGQGTIHAPSWRFRPRPMRLRRFRAAVRSFSQALFWAVPI